MNNSDYKQTDQVLSKSNYWQYRSIQKNKNHKAYAVINNMHTFLFVILSEKTHTVYKKITDIYNAAQKQIETKFGFNKKNIEICNNKKTNDFLGVENREFIVLDYGVFEEYDSPYTFLYGSEIFAYCGRHITIDAVFSGPLMYKNHPDIANYFPKSHAVFYFYNEKNCRLMIMRVYFVCDQLNFPVCLFKIKDNFDIATLRKVKTIDGGLRVSPPNFGPKLSLEIEKIKNNFKKIILEIAKIRKETLKQLKLLVDAGLEKTLTMSELNRETTILDSLGKLDNSQLKVFLKKINPTIQALQEFNALSTIPFYEKTQKIFAEYKSLAEEKMAKNNEKIKKNHSKNQSNTINIKSKNFGATLKKLEPSTQLNHGEEKKQSKDKNSKIKKNKKKRMKTLDLVMKKFFETQNNDFESILENPIKVIQFQKQDKSTLPYSKIMQHLLEKALQDPLHLKKIQQKIIKRLGFLFEISQQYRFCLDALTSHYVCFVNKKNKKLGINKLSIFINGINNPLYEAITAQGFFNPFPLFVDENGVLTYVDFIKFYFLTAYYKGLADAFKQGFTWQSPILETPGIMIYYRQLKNIHLITDNKSVKEIRIWSDKEYNAIANIIGKVISYSDFYNFLSTSRDVLIHFSSDLKPKITASKLEAYFFSSTKLIEYLSPEKITMLMIRNVCFIINFYDAKKILMHFFLTADDKIYKKPFSVFIKNSTDPRSFENDDNLSSFIGLRRKKTKYFHVMFAFKPFFLKTKVFQNFKYFIECCSDKLLQSNIDFRTFEYFLKLIEKGFINLKSKIKNKKAKLTVKKIKASLSFIINYTYCAMFLFYFVDLYEKKIFILVTEHIFIYSKKTKELISSYAKKHGKTKQFLSEFAGLDLFLTFQNSLILGNEMQRTLITTSISPLVSLIRNNLKKKYRMKEVDVNKITDPIIQENLGRCLRRLVSSGLIAEALEVCEWIKISPYFNCQSIITEANKNNLSSLDLAKNKIKQNNDEFFKLHHLLKGYCEDVNPSNTVSHAM